MTLEDYQANIKSITDSTDLLDNEFFDFEFSPNRDEYLNTFKFYTETLQHNNYYGVDPSYIFFRNAMDLNARAKRTSNNIFLIGINMGTVNWLIDNFKLNETLISDSNIKLFDKLGPFTDTPINNLMFQAGLHFTFYHEFAHLVQNSKYLDSSLEENPSPTISFDIDRHLLEIDADTFSALCLGTHVMQYSEKLFGDKLNQTLIEAMMILFSIPIIFYLLSFSGNKHDLYFKEYTHPHPAIRLTNFLMVFIKYCNDSLNVKDTGFAANQGDVFLTVMSIAEELQLKFFEENTVTRYKDFVTKARPLVIKYLGELVTINESSKSTSVYQWNKHRS